MLRPGGHFVFDVSFPNAHNPANLLLRLKPERLRPPNFMKFWTRAEVERLLHDTGLAAKTGASPSARRACGPAEAGRAGPGPARAPGEPPRRLRADGLDGVLAESYIVYSPGLLA